MRGTMARLGGVSGRSQSVALMARVDEDDTESVDVRVAVVGVEVPDVVHTRFLHRSRILANCRSSSTISRCILAAVATLSGSARVLSTRLSQFVDVEELFNPCAELRCALQ